MLVIIGADEYAEKGVLAIMDGLRKNADSWRGLLKGLTRLKKRGLTVPPELAAGDGAPGFRTALRDVLPPTRQPRCRVRKTANVLGAMPKSLHEKAKSELQDIWTAETRKKATAAFDLFVETYGVKYERVIARLIKDRDVLLTFYDFPAEPWKHIRTPNPTESVLPHGPQPHAQNQRRPEPKDRPDRGLEADDVRQDKVGENLRPKPSAQTDPRDCFQGRDQATA